MPDLVYLLITLTSFAGLALLVGVIDRRLAPVDTADDPEPGAGPGAGPGTEDREPVLTR